MGGYIAMCFSPEASFIAAGALAPVGVVALRSVQRREQLILGALPLLFAGHQAVEGVVWLGLGGRLSHGVLEATIRVYLTFAQVVLPVLVPVGVLTFEHDSGRRRWLLGPVAVGAAVSARLLWVITAHPVGAHVLGDSIVYDTDVHFGFVVAAGYVVATCGPALLSSSWLLRAFGVASLAGLTLAAFVKYSAVTSVWCFYAALVSGFILLALRSPRPFAPRPPWPRGRSAIGRTRSAGARPPAP
jgi:hypothetical protein